MQPFQINRSKVIGGNNCYIIWMIIVKLFLWRIKYWVVVKAEVSLVIEHVCFKPLGGTFICDSC
jgi:hypothetical protein